MSAALFEGTTKANLRRRFGSWSPWHCTMLGWLDSKSCDADGCSDGSDPAVGVTGTAGLSVQVAYQRVFAGVDARYIVSSAGVVSYDVVYPVMGPAAHALVGMKF